ncbi:MAG: hypothetical protein ACHP79_14920, partial [Terriglobales bacterium]
PGEAGAQVWSSKNLMQRAVDAGGPLANHIKQLYVDYRPPAGTTLWSPMWDELLVAALVDPSVIKKSATCISIAISSTAQSTATPWSGRRRLTSPHSSCPIAARPRAIARNG